MQNAKNMTQHKKLVQLLTDFLGTLPPDAHIERLPGGASTAINAKLVLRSSLESEVEATVDGVCYIIRLFDPAISEQKRITEIKAQQLAAKHDIAPTVFYGAPDHTGIVMECIEGTTLKLAEAEEPATIKALANTLRILHSIPAEFLPIHDVVATIEQQYQTVIKILEPKPFPLLDQAIATVRLLEKATERSKKYAFCHGDLNPTNMFYVNGKIILIDWTDAIRAKPFFDLAIAALLSGMNKEQTELLLSSYLQKEPIETQQAEFFFMQQTVRLGFALNMLLSLHAANALRVLELPPSQEPLYMLLRKEEELYSDRLREVPPEFTYAMATSALNELINAK